MQTGKEKDKAVLLVGKCVLRETGNATTLERLGRAVKGSGWECVTLDPDSVPDGSSVHDLVTQHNIVVALGIHAYRSARVLLVCQDLGVPYVLIFGGTDVNECVRETVKKDVMGRVVAGARSLVAFQASTRDTVLQIWLSLKRDKIWILPQAVQVNPDQDFNVLSYLVSVDAEHLSSRTKDDQKAWKTSNSMNKFKLESESLRETILVEAYRSSKENGPHMKNWIGKGGKVVSPQHNSGTLINVTAWEHQERYPSKLPELLPDVFQPLVLLVAGLRPVKDVLYLGEAWSRWHKERGRRGRFLIIGPPLDPHYTAYVENQVERLSGVRLCPTLSPTKCQALIRDATVLVNSSRSESMSSAILEAMALGTPVLARDIPANASLIKHGHTGLLYHSPDSFLEGLDGIIQDSVLKDGLVTAAKDHVAQFHSLDQERDILSQILKQAMP